MSDDETMTIGGSVRSALDATFPGHERLDRRRSHRNSQI